MRRAAFRLGLAPVLLLAWNVEAGDALPFLGPSLSVFFLTMSPARPKLKQLFGALVLVTALTFAFSRSFAALADNPAAIWVALLAVAIWAFARLAQRPADLVATLTLISASLVVAIRGFAEVLGEAVPVVMGVAVAQAIVATLIAHALLPSPPVRATAAPTMDPVRAPQAMQAVGRGVALLVALGFALLLDDNSSILVALTAVTVLSAQAEATARNQGRGLLLANGVAAIVVLPLIAVAALRPDPAILLLVALAGGLWLAGGIGQGGWRTLAARAGSPVYIVLVGSLLPKAGETALPLLIDRLLTLGLVMLYALTALTLLRRSDARRTPMPA